MSLTCTPAKEVQLFPGLGLYSGISGVWYLRLRGSTGDTKLPLQQVTFIIVESGIALFTIQLIRIVFLNLPVESAADILVIMSLLPIKCLM